MIKEIGNHKKFFNKSNLSGVTSAKNETVRTDSLNF